MIALSLSPQNMLTGRVHRIIGVGHPNKSWNATDVLLAGSVRLLKLIHKVSWLRCEQFDSEFLIFLCDFILFALIGSHDCVFRRSTSFVALPDLVQGSASLAHIDLSSVDDSLENLRILLHNFVPFIWIEKIVVRLLNKVCNLKINGQFNTL